MAEIKSPMTAAMKRRAKAAIDVASEARLLPDGTVYEAVTPDYDAYTPRELRAIILRQARDPVTRAAMTMEGWFQPTLSRKFRGSSNTKVSVEAQELS